MILDLEDERFEQQQNIVVLVRAVYRSACCCKNKKSSTLHSICSLVLNSTADAKTDILSVSVIHWLVSTITRTET